MQKEIPMNLIFSSVGNLNWRGLFALVVFFFAGYVTRVVIEQIKPIWKTHKELRKIQNFASMVHDAESGAAPDTPPDVRTKVKVASAILNAEYRAERQTDPNRKP
jgi:hypothetical protein